LLEQQFRVIRLDLPGFGLSDAEMDMVNPVDMYVRYIHAFLNQLQIKECSLIGNSLGGWIAWEYALKYPKRVQKLALIDAAGFLDEDSIPLAFKMARTPLVNRIVRFAIRKNILEQFLKEVYFDQNRVTPQLVNRYYDLFTKEGNPEAFLVLANSKVKDRTSKLKQIKTPTLIMWGKEDQWIPVEYAYRFHQRLAQNEVIIYDEVGHLPMEEIPEQTAQDLTIFLKKPILTLT
ncbi:MAG: alpha/beta fold hydrolase, partial [Chitinophagales bacterium]